MPTCARRKKMGSVPYYSEVGPILAKLKCLLRADPAMQPAMVVSRQIAYADRHVYPFCAGQYRPFAHGNRQPGLINQWLALPCGKPGAMALPRSGRAQPRPWLVPGNAWGIYRHNPLTRGSGRNRGRLAAMSGARKRCAAFHMTTGHAVRGAHTD